MVEERDRFIRMYKDLVAVKSKGGFIQSVHPNMEEDAQLDLAVKLSEIEGLKREKEMMTQEIVDLQNEIAGWKVEVATIII